MNLKLNLIALCVPLLAACGSAVKMPEAAQVQSDAQIRAASAWQAPLPHNGSTVQLSNWWTQLGDPVFDELMQAAQTGNANLAAALTRIAQARTGIARADDAITPSLNLNAQGSRGVQQPKAPPATSLSVGVQASWELDLWGANQATLSAAQLRARGAELSWHEARVAVAAEMASAYTGYRYCENLLALTLRDAESRNETARLAELTAKAGFSAPAVAQLARASSLDAGSSVTATQAQCDAQIKSLVALSGMAEPTLREKLKANSAAAGKISAQAAMFSIANAVTQVPAQLLAQRPDIAAAQQAVTAAALDIRTADARRYPSLSLNGNIGAGSVRQMGMTSEGLTWGIGPIALNLPLTNQASTRSNTEAAVAAYNEAVINLQARSRQAVSEVETALVQLNAAAQRGTQTKAAAEGYTASLAATQSRYRAGLASLVELEDARRTALFAQQNQLAVERDRIAAWISLYRATGGGWTADAPINAALNTPAK
ncbi:efflux transporter outer membrane subunit [Variovorax sp. PCZ-1]|uniref:efflux transporter outer membrane subunit n=1 Tax=Variovorax sp. PCZ-1 TaxID=2835533 RepID=UPI001BCFA2D2|nr:efflux transporter outer membrane subunit [Variovorax sp. PCZ-1]MBS7808657.1 efflux transporter outer membrane subunit [Variovorax sp. PCZ-1]